MEQDGDVSARGGRSALAYRTGGITHTHLDAVVPFASALDAAVDFKQDLVMLQGDFGDLDEVAGARSRAKLLAGFGPLLDVILAGRLERQRLLRLRQIAF